MVARRRTNPPARRFRNATALLLAGALIGLSEIGCSPSVGRLGSTGTIGVYSGRTLAARMPAGVDVLTAAAAGKAALIERGYVVSRREGTSGRVVVIGRTPAAGWRRHTDRTVTFRAIRKMRGVRVEVHITPLPNEAESRAVLSAALEQLGA